MTSSSPSKCLLLKQERAVGLCLLMVLATFLPVLAVAVFSNSILMFSDVLEYGRAFLASFIAWKVLRAIRMGKTQRFDYGTSKLETMAGVAGSIVYVAGLLVAGGFAAHRLVYPVELHEWGIALGAFYQLFASSIDGWLWAHNRRLARESYSSIMEMQWRANRADALSGLAISVALLLTFILRPFAWSVYIDPISALLLIGYAIVTFFPGLATGINELLDKTLQEDLQIRIDRHLAQTYEGYDAFHGVRSRRASERIFIEIGLSFSPDKTIAEAMETINRLRHGIEEDIPGSEVRVALLPMEPLTSGQKHIV